VADQKRAALAASKKPISGEAVANDQGEIGEVIDLVKTYVRQETIGPLKGLGRKVGIGVAGALLIGLGVFFLSLGLLRLIQDKVPRLATGSLSWLSYLIVVVFCGLVSFIAVVRIKKIEKELN
jgi:Putative Actinobacterial Holin-X, holin superfamily III